MSIDPVQLRVSCASEPFICDSSCFALTTEHSQSTQTYKWPHIPTPPPDSFFWSSLSLFAKISVMSSPKIISLINMLAFIFWLVWTIVPCVCAATALSPSGDTSPGQSQPPSPTLDAQTSPICVRAAQNPDWAGAIDAKSCADAIARLWDRVSPYGYTRWKFWASELNDD